MRGNNGKRIGLCLLSLCLLMGMVANMSSCSLLFLASSFGSQLETTVNTHIETLPPAVRPEPNVDMTAIREEIDSMSVLDFTDTEEVTDYVKISFEGFGDVVIRLRPDIAPKTVENFKTLVSQGFYNGLTIHRVVKNFVIQGGDPWGDGTGGSGTTIKGEFSANGVQNDLSHITGVISMARKSYPMDSATSQFFICNANALQLDGQYAGFGYVVAGMEVIFAISDVDVSGETPVEKVIMSSVTFVTP